MRKAITTEEMVLLKEASEMFNETGCVPGFDGEQVSAEKLVPDVKEHILETIYDPESDLRPGDMVCLDSAAAELIREIMQRRPLN